MSRNAPAPVPRLRRIAVGLGTAAGAAAIAASFSMGNAPVAHADVFGADTAGDVVGALSAEALSAAGVSNTLALSYLIEAFDPNSFSATGSPTDVLGLFGYYTDTYLLGPTGIDAELAPLVQELVGTIGSGTPGTYIPEVSELTFALDPESFVSATTLTAPTDEFGELAYGLDTYLLGPFGLEPVIAPFVQEIISSLPSAAESIDASPAADLLAALDPAAFSAGIADLATPTATGLLDPVIDGLLNSGLALF